MTFKSLYQKYIDLLAHLWTKLVPIAWLREGLETLIWALVLALILRTFVVQAFWIPSESMVPTLLVGDRVLVCKFWYRLREPQRGDVFVFKNPQNPKEDYVKRLIAVPGDVVEMRRGVVYINGEALEEPYVMFHDSFNMRPVAVPEESYVAMGDNRPNSHDSRYWGFVPKKNIRGPVFWRFWPLNRLGTVD